MQKLTFNSIGKILDKRTRRKLLGLAIARVAANLLDLVGLAGIALLATSFGSLASGSATRAPLSIPVIGEVLINEVQAVMIAAVVAIVFLMKSGFSIWLNLLTSQTVATLESKFSSELAEDFFNDIESSQEDAPKTVAEFQNLAINSTYAISSFLNSRMTFVAEASLLTAMLSIFIAINPIAAISMLLFMSSILFFLNRLIGVRIKRNGEIVMQGSQMAFESSRDLFGIRREAVASGSTPHWVSKFTLGRYKAAQGGALIYTLNSLPRYVVETSLILGIFAFIGGVVIFSDLATQSITIGVFLAGGLRIVGSLLPLQGAFNSMQDAANRGGPAFTALAERRKLPNNKTSTGVLALPPQAGIIFHDVTFQYPGSKVPILNRLSLEFKPLTKIAIVGPSGAGKSTIFDLATGFREPTSGSVTIGGHTPQELLVQNPGTFGVVTQRPQLVTGSILENVSLEPDEKTDTRKVMQSLERAGLKNLTLKRDWHAMQIQPDAGQFSGGEIQRIGLARALYRSPKILLLDEATSGLDAETEADITKVLRSLKDHMTIIMIAHRLSTVMNADTIIYLDKGRVLAQGTFQQLKIKVPDFARAVELMDLGGARGA